MTTYILKATSYAITGGDNRDEDEYSMYLRLTFSRIPTMREIGALLDAEDSGLEIHIKDSVFPENVHVALFVLGNF